MSQALLARHAQGTRDEMLASAGTRHLRELMVQPLPMHADPFVLRQKWVWPCRAIPR